VRVATDKIAKRQIFADFFVSQGTARQAQVLSIVVDSRGAIPKDTLKVLNILWMDGKRLGLFLALCGVGSSVQITCMKKVINDYVSILIYYCEVAS
jgi:hypothetical protein